MDIDALARIRRELVEAQIALKDAEEALRLAGMAAENEIIEDAGGIRALGPNEGEQKRVLRMRVEQHGVYAERRKQLAEAQARVLRLETERDILLDERREREWKIRERLAEAIASRFLRTLEPDEENGGDEQGRHADAAMESIADHLIDVDGRRVDVRTG